MPAESNQPTRREVAERLRAEAVGVKLERSQFGATRKLDSEQKDQIGNLFGADADRLSAGKKLLNKRHEAYLKVTSFLNQARQVWLDSTLPYPEPGIRLIRRDKVVDFEATMRTIRNELRDSAELLERVYHDELIPDARERLGDLYNQSDYPSEIRGEFDLTVSFPNVEPGEYLREISPRLYEQEQERIRARFEEAIALAEQAFTDEFAKAVQHLVERLTPGVDGKQKLVRESALGNLTDFFQKFRTLDIGSNAQLSELVEQAENAVKGIDVKSVRTDIHARQSIKEAFEGLSGQLEKLLVDKPKRKITLEDVEPAQQEQPVEQASSEPEVAA